MSGVQKSMVDLISKLDKEKYQVTVICQSEGELTEVLSKRQIPFILVSSLKREINFFYDFKALIDLIKIFRENKFDIIHTHSSKPGFLGRIAGKIAKVECLVHTVQGFAFHEFSRKLSVFVFTLLERIVGKFSNKIIIVNDQDFQYASKKRIAPFSRLTKISNGIDLNGYEIKVDVVKKRRELNINAQHHIVGFVGRLWEQKAPHDFISAIPIVLEKISNVVFLIIGDGHLRSSLETLVQKLLIQDHIQFLGWRNDVPEILKILDVFVQTSLWEGLSLSILEAMAAGKPIIATNIKGNNELVVNGITGYLVPPNNPEMVAYHIIRLLQDNKLAEDMGKLGRKRVEEKFDIKLHVEQIKNIYHQIFTV
jgi:glycosyltransferase involved in cell wall biosynthesis